MVPFLIKALLALSLVCTALGQAKVLSRCKNTGDVANVSRTCFDLLCKGNTMSGVYKVYPDGTDRYSVDVFCDQDTDGGGWTLFQRRLDGWVDFNRNWNRYKLGFGDINGEHWLGNDKIVDLLGTRTNEMRVDMEAFSNEKAYALYGSFTMGEESTGYQIRYRGYKGTAGDSLVANGLKFTTVDRDNDRNNKTNCAVDHQGPWWYSSCRSSNLNSKYYSSGSHKAYGVGVNWSKWKGNYESLKATEMKFRVSK